MLFSTLGGSGLLNKLLILFHILIFPVPYLHYAFYRQAVIINAPTTCANLQTNRIPFFPRVFLCQGSACRSYEA